MNGSNGRQNRDDLKSVELGFDAAMMEIYERAGREVGYWATRYLQMLRKLGGLDTARQLLAGGRLVGDEVRFEVDVAADEVPASG